MLTKIRFYISIIIAHCTYLAIKLRNKSSGTSFVGLLTLKYNPDFLKYCQKYIENEVVTITGTNGKSTTSGLVAHFLKNGNKSILHNLKGANMLTGIANVFALNIKPFKKFDYAVLETDEAYLAKLYDNLEANILIVTNLFRDQLDRYGELNTTAEFIKSGIKKNPNLKLILNADDPIVRTFDEYGNAIFYGFKDVEYKFNCHQNSNAPSEIFNCKCGNELKYDKQFFAQQGHYYCDKCDYKRPDCNYEAVAEIYQEYSILKINYEGKVDEFKTNLTGLYNAYNALSAIVFALENGLKKDEIQASLNTFKAIFGRTEKREINGHPTVIQLIKNPTGASEVLKTVDLNSNIIVAINDNYADGRDISWLWDSDFEQLQNAQKTIVASGTRANDVATRLKYAGLSPSKIIIEPNLKKAIGLLSKEADNNDKITILPSYTALLKINQEKL
ncbi:MAG: MurT ligase domain-containing protein [Candidatus Gastranaerophilales bacterium]